MSDRIEMDLLSNALSSLREAAYQRRRENYKMAIFLIAHFFELIFKHKLKQINRELIYRKSKDRKKPKTISFSESIELLKEKGVLQKEVVFEGSEYEILKELKSLRNDIAHYGFSLSVKREELRLGRLFHYIQYTNSCLGVGELMDEFKKPIYKDLADDEKLYEEMRKSAKISYELSTPSARDIMQGAEYSDARLCNCSCEYCGDYGLFFRQDGYIQCHSCGEAMDPKYIQECSRCGGYYVCWSRDDDQGICDSCWDYVMSKG